MSTSKPKPNAVTTTSSVDFVKLLQDHPDFLQECSEALTVCVQATRTRMGKSKLQITFTFKPAKQGQVVQVTPADPKLTLPSQDWAPKPYFATDHGQLLRDHPDQMQLEYEEDDEPRVSFEDHED